MAVIKFPGRRQTDDEPLDQEDTIEESYDNDVDDDGYRDDGREDPEDIAAAAEEKRRHGKPSSDAERQRGRKSGRRKFLRVLRLCVVLCAVGAAAAFLLNFQENTVYTTAETEETAKVDIPESSEFTILEGNLCVYNKDGISLIGSKGNTIWNIPYEMQQPILDVCGGMLAVGDYGGSTIYLCDSTGQVGQIATNLPLRALSVAENGNVACVLADTDATWIYLYDKSGNQIAYIKRSMSQSGYPVSVSISPNGKLLCCAQLTVDDTDIKTSVVFYNFGSVGQNSVDNAVSAYDYASEVVAHTHFLGNDSSVAVSDAGAAFFNGEDVPTSISDVKHPSDLQGVWTGGNYVGLLYLDTTGESQYELDVYNASGEKTGTIHFDMDFTTILMDGDRIYIYDAQSILIYTAAGEEKYSGSFQDTVREVLPTDRANRLLLLTGSSLETMILQ